MLMTMTVDHCR